MLFTSLEVTVHVINSARPMSNPGMKKGFVNTESYVKDVDISLRQILISFDLGKFKFFLLVFLLSV